MMKVISSLRMLIFIKLLMTLQLYTCSQTSKIDLGICTRMILILKVTTPILSLLLIQMKLCLFQLTLGRRVCTALIVMITQLFM